MKPKDPQEGPSGQELIPADDFLVVELDDRLEFGAAVLETDLVADDNYGCNGTSCKVNLLACGKQ